VDASQEAGVKNSALTILGYHNIESTHYFSAEPGQGTHAFEQQLRFLRRAMNVVPLGEALQAWERGGSLPSRAVSITFDDGYRDALEIAAPLLERYSLPATFFVVPAIVARDAHAWWERVSWSVRDSHADRLRWGERVIRLGDGGERAEVVEDLCVGLKKLDHAERDRAIAQLVDELAPAVPFGDDMFLDWEQCRALLRRGFEIGSHSYRHTILARETAAEQHDDLGRSKKILEDELCTRIDLLAYPNGEVGDFDADTFDALRAAGYTHAVTTIPGRNHRNTPCYELRRAVISPVGGVRALLEGLARTWKPR
jgi:peptidoglycan/xylan/chitin deacetylase (PgdA/CDA1 family)